MFHVEQSQHGHRFFPGDEFPSCISLEKRDYFLSELRPAVDEAANSHRVVYSGVTNPSRSFFKTISGSPREFQGMSEKTDKASSPRPDEPKPERPMQPVFEPAPEPDPRNRNTRPEMTTPSLRDEKLREQEEEEFHRRNKTRKETNQAGRT